MTAPNLNSSVIGSKLQFFAETSGKTEKNDLPKQNGGEKNSSTKFQPKTPGKALSLVTGGEMSRAPAKPASGKAAAPAKAPTLPNAGTTYKAADPEAPYKDATKLDASKKKGVALKPDAAGTLGPNEAKLKKASAPGKPINPSALAEAKKKDAALAEKKAKEEALQMALVKHTKKIQIPGKGEVGYKVMVDAPGGKVGKVGDIPVESAKLLKAHFDKQGLVQVTKDGAVYYVKPSAVKEFQ